MVWPHWCCMYTITSNGRAHTIFGLIRYRKLTKCGHCTMESSTTMRIVRTLRIYVRCWRGWQYWNGNRQFTWAVGECDRRMDGWWLSMRHSDSGGGRHCCTRSGSTPLHQMIDFLWIIFFFRKFDRFLWKWHVFAHRWLQINDINTAISIREYRDRFIIIEHSPVRLHKASECMRNCDQCIQIRNWLVVCTIIKLP